MSLAAIHVSSDLAVTFHDQTRHYFGGYYHVRVLVFCDIQLLSHYFTHDSEYDTARKLLGESVRFERILEKMAVPTADVEKVRDHLVDTFRSTAIHYLSRPEFPGSVVLAEFRKHSVKSIRGPL